MLINKNLNRKNFSIFFWSSFCALIPSYSLSKFGLFEDLKIYYYFFQQVSQVGIVEAFFIFYGSTGKFEPILFLVFYLQSFIIPVNEFFFLFFNFLILNFGFSKLILKILGSDEYYQPYILVISILSYSFFSREIYVLRSMYAFLFFLMLVNSNSFKGRIFYILIGSLAHVSFCVFTALFFLIKFMKEKLSTFGFLVFLSFFICFAQLIIINASFLSVLTASGDISVFTAVNDGHSVQSIILMVFTFFAILSIIRSGFFESHSSLLIMFLVLIIISIINYNNYHLMNRVAAPALCIVPFLVMFQKNNRWSIFIKIGYSISILLTLRLIYLFVSGNFIVPE